MVAPGWGYIYSHVKEALLYTVRGFVTKVRFLTGPVQKI